MLYTYYVVIKCWKALVLGPGALLGLYMPLGALIHCHSVKGHLHVSDSQARVSSLELSLESQISISTRLFDISIWIPD